jgi:formylglycine-generating enzyme required for sulfatase activity
MKKILVLLIVMLGLDVDAEKAVAVADERSKMLVAGHEYLKQQQYQEARAAFEAHLQQYPADAIAHFYLGDACRGLKAWVCAESHYETSLELDAHSSVAGLAKQRARKAKVWRLLDEGNQVLSEPNALPRQIAQAEDTLDIANKLGLDDEQQAVSTQLHVKLQQRHHVNFKPHHLQQSMVLIPAGEFIRGSWTGDADERPVRRVYLDAYFFDKDQLTVGEYAKFLDATSHSVPSDWNIMSRAMHKNRPVVNVNWADAAAYCKWAGKRQPTEAEWEKAARGTDGRTYPWGDESPTKFHGNMKKELWNSHMGLTPVGMFEEGKSPYGINDMAGNVWEWVSDWYDEDYYSTAPSRNPTGPATGISKVVRGGSWGSGPEGLRSAERETHVPSFQGYGTGFRCAKTAGVIR